MPLNKNFANMLPMDISMRIRRERMARGLSMRGLGTILGVSGSAVAQWEAGGNITWENRLSLSNALEIPIIDFLPPEMADGEFTIKDPEERLLIERFRRLHRRLREVYLGMVIAQTETLDAQAMPTEPGRRQTP